MLIWKLHDILSQIINDYPQIPAPEEIERDSLNSQQLYSVQMHSKILCSSEATWVEMKMGYSFFRKTKKIVSCGCL